MERLIIKMDGPPAFIFVWVQMGYEFPSGLSLVRSILPQHRHLSLPIPYDKMPDFDHVPLSDSIDVTRDRSVAMVFERDHLTDPHGRATPDQGETVKFFCSPQPLWPLSGCGLFWW